MNKEQQKKLITEIMDLDAKDGLYEDDVERFSFKHELKKVYKLAEESWEGCDGCDENDKHFWMNGFRTGYNRAKPDVISDEQLENTLHTSGRYDTPNHKDSIMSYGKICEHDDGYLCEHRRKYIIDLFKKQEISDEEIEKAAQELKDGWTYKPIFFIEGAKWYREQSKQRQ